MKYEKRKVMALAAAAFAIIIFLNIPIFNMLTLTDKKTGNLVYARSVKDAQSFYTSFIHSVNRVPVYEYYKIIDNRFVIYKTSFYSYGAGMPEYNPKQNVVIENGIVTIDNLNIVMKDFSLFVGTVAEHKIHFFDEEYKLSKFLKPGNAIKFEIKRQPVYIFLRWWFYERR